MKCELQIPWPPKLLAPNARPKHWGALLREKKRFRRACYLHAQEQRVPRIATQPAQMLVRLQFQPATNRRRDQDNLVAAMKAGLDGIAEALGVDDHCFVILPPTIAPAQKGRHPSVAVTFEWD